MKADSVNEYIENVPEDRKEPMMKLRAAILDNLPEGFQETMGYGMPAYAVPHSIYPDGYHCKPEEPVPFINIASQKNFIAFYHMGVYAMPALLEWFQAEYPKHMKTKLDMGKSCIRFKNVNKIPYELLGELVAKVSVDEWIEVYESSIKK
ncbi:MAG: DUF1801 domain-containing protein [Rhodothermaceae bacterium]|nr:DUF1801 domain-containing protein [Rhodothermaceae bacterium]